MMELDESARWRDGAAPEGADWFLSSLSAPPTPDEAALAASLRRIEALPEPRNSRKLWLAAAFVLTATVSAAGALMIAELVESGSHHAATDNAAARNTTSQSDVTEPSSEPPDVQMTMIPEQSDELLPDELLPDESMLPVEQTGGSTEGERSKPPPREPRANPRLVHRGMDVRASPPQPTVGEGYLLVNTAPPSEVYVDGRLVGMTPQVRIPLRAGQHHVELRALDGRTLRRTIQVRAGENTRLVLRHQNAQTATARVSVIASGGWAEIFVNGRSRGTTPAQLELPAGNHRFEFRFPDGRVTRRAIQLQAGTQRRITVALPRPRPRLR
ncbi:MAG: PEGA domain-containing protein [Myxococcota bacterium]